MEKRYTVRLNSTEKIEELLQVLYDESCRLFNEVQDEIRKMTNNVNLGEEGMSVDEKAKYAKSINDFENTKLKTLQTKKDIATLMTEVLKHKGSIDEAMSDPTFSKASSMGLKNLKADITKTLKEDGGSSSYDLKK